MASLYDKFLDFIGIEENDEADDERDDYYEPPRSRNNAVTLHSNRSGNYSRERRSLERMPAASNGSNLPISGAMKMIVYHPVSYEDTQAIIDNLKNRKPIIVNMEELDVDCAQRILDFLSGAVYALSGTMCKISRGIFVVAPNNYDVVGNGQNDEDDMI